MNVPLNSEIGKFLQSALVNGQAKYTDRPAEPESPAEKSTGLHVLRIPNFVPVPLNRLMSAHWAVAARMKKADREVIAHHAKEQGIPKVRIVRSAKPRKTGTGKPTKGAYIKGTGPRRRVTIRVTLAKGERKYDNDALHKSCWDALVAVSLLVNDSDKWCENGGVEWRRGTERMTEIILEDLE